MLVYLELKVKEKIAYMYHGGLKRMIEGVIEVKEDKRKDILILRLKGRLDAISSPIAEKRVFASINSGESKLIMDFGGVDYLSSAGMRMLLSTMKKLKGVSGKLILCHITSHVMDVLRMSGFDHVLEFYADEEEALRHF